jgi:hypothetical protein
MATYQEYLDKQRERRVKMAFAPLIKAPATGTVVFPSMGARMQVRRTSGAENSTCLRIHGRNIVFGKGVSQVIDFIAANSTIQIMSGFELYVDTGMGLFKLIGRG